MLAGNKVNIDLMREEVINIIKSSMTGCSYEDYNKYIMFFLVLLCVAVYIYSKHFFFLFSFCPLLFYISSVGNDLFFYFTS